MSNVRVVTLTEELDHPWNLSVVAKHDESECGHGRPTDVIVGVRYGDVQKLPDSLIVGGTSVCQGDRVHSSVTQDGIL